MSNVVKIISGAIVVLSLAGVPSAFAAAAAAAPAAAAPAAAAPAATTAAPAAATGTPATGVVCKIVKSGKYVHVQAMNNGTAAVPKGDTFAFVIVGPTKKTSETFTFKGDLPAGKSVTITKAIKAAAVASCTPSA